MSSGITVRGLDSSDKKAWFELFQGYADFYKVSVSSEIKETVWQWLLDPSHPLEGLLAVTSEGCHVGLAHFRACPRSLSGKDMGFLDDLFINPKFRGLGIADKIFEKLKEISEERNWPVLRWLTQNYNYRGRSFYDKYTGSASDFIMYQLKIDVLA
ncbi:N-acetyltransferase [Prodigiosinella confusarubida]|uniref:N-acetyltransferase n=1 Tax=Serratia sp. (strain ATCC 39006) TaxID=104623 RepID=A0A2I5T6S3_SERS3|nr:MULTISPECIES: GNAT family N-acetyltransferase [Enterobacterales]AUH00269.1 N-acetyltransferase [Serratia sp. ATCC 39006]AUH04589.1 N-acetyltransferase [Serratia sp. ATCC 39006]WJV52466.1 GNAT family N-acetyltransferase [Prodigiosinella sp. LS101]WJV56820.1 GNAT family N-acetyltransferase [Pectobacteriaceae bacterium C111]